MRPGREIPAMSSAMFSQDLSGVSRALAGRIGESVPRYTSYPTAPHFHAGVTGETVRGWLAAIPGETISLYVHIPFCDRLCWFCACHTKLTLRYEPVSDYLKSLHAEIALVAGLVGGRAQVRSVHFGGGSPTMLRPDDLVALDAAMRAAFSYRPDAEISVEIDPNDMDAARFDALAAIGMTRASLGVQDFDPKVQKAINREQGFAMTKAVVDGVRARGVGSVNLDLLYGLPHQTRQGLAATVACCLSLRPDRIALFGYAHVPWFKKHQTMINEAALPDAVMRFEQSRLAARLIGAAGYEAIGLDHFARSSDSLAVAASEGRLRRNFQGYTDDASPILIGLGPSSISRLPQGYAQNAPAAAIYGRLVGEGRVPATRGLALSAEDHARGWLIERLMCDFGFSRGALVARFGEIGQALVAEAERHVASDGDGLLLMRGGDFVVSLDGRPFVRSVAARFDPYLASGKARHSAAV